MTDDYLQSVSAFRQALLTLQEQAALANPDPASLQALFLDAQQGFHHHLMGVDADHLPEVVAAYWQTFQTESNRQLRLLGTDVMFLQAARQSTTFQRRQAQMGDRIKTLIQYCDGILDGT